MYKCIALATPAACPPNAPAPDRVPTPASRADWWHTACHRSQTTAPMLGGRSDSDRSEYLAQTTVQVRVTAAGCCIQLCHWTFCATRALSRSSSLVGLTEAGDHPARWPCAPCTNRSAQRDRIVRHQPGTRTTIPRCTPRPALRTRPSSRAARFDTAIPPNCPAVREQFAPGAFGPVGKLDVLPKQTTRPRQIARGSSGRGGPTNRADSAAALDGLPAPSTAEHGSTPPTRSSYYGRP